MSEVIMATFETFRQMYKFLKEVGMYDKFKEKVSHLPSVIRDLVETTLLSIEETEENLKDSVMW